MSFKRRGSAIPATSMNGPTGRKGNFGPTTMANGGPKYFQTKQSSSAYVRRSHVDSGTYQTHASRNNPPTRVANGDLPSKEHRSGLSMTGVYTDEPLCSTMSHMLGSNIRVYTTDGKCYEGIFSTWNQSMDISVDLVHEVSNDDDDVDGPSALAISLQNASSQKFFSRDQIVMCVTVDPVTAEDDMINSQDFATDGAISNNRDHSDKAELRSLHPWQDDTNVKPPSGTELSLGLPDPTDGKSGGKPQFQEVMWSADEMFKCNAEQYGVVSSFKDNLEGYTVALPTDMDPAEYSELEAKASRLAREMEHDSGASFNRQRRSANRFGREGSSEKDGDADYAPSEEVMFSAVVRQTRNSTAERRRSQQNKGPAVSEHVPHGQDSSKYVPPNRRHSIIEQSISNKVESSSLATESTEKVTDKLGAISIKSDSRHSNQTQQTVQDAKQTGLGSSQFSPAPSETTPVVPASTSATPQPTPSRLNINAKEFVPRSALLSASPPISSPAASVGQNNTVAANILRSQVQAQLSSQRATVQGPMTPALAVPHMGFVSPAMGPTVAVDPSSFGATVLQTAPSGGVPGQMVMLSAPPPVVAGHHIGGQVSQTPVFRPPVQSPVASSGGPKPALRHRHQAPPPSTPAAMLAVSSIQDSVIGQRVIGQASDGHMLMSQPPPMLSPFASPVSAASTVVAAGSGRQMGNQPGQYHQQQHHHHQQQPQPHLIANKDNNVGVVSSVGGSPAVATYLSPPSSDGRKSGVVHGQAVPDAARPYMGDVINLSNPPPLVDFGAIQAQPATVSMSAGGAPLTPQQLLIGQAAHQTAQAVPASPYPHPPPGPHQPGGPDQAAAAAVLQYAAAPISHLAMQTGTPHNPGQPTYMGHPSMRMAGQPAAYMILPQGQMVAVNTGLVLPPAAGPVPSAAAQVGQVTRLYAPQQPQAHQPPPPTQQQQPTA